MKIPFKTDEFLAIFEQYNTDVWPAQIIFYLLAFASLTVVFTGYAGRHKIISGIMAFFWIWMGAIYHILYFSSINSAAFLFGALFILQGFILGFAGLHKKRLEFTFRKDVSSVTGVIFVVYGLLIYPLLSIASGHIFPASPTFGLPCPTIIYTLGLLLLTTQRIPWFYIIIPVLWTFVGFSAALSLSMAEDYALGIAGITAVAMLYLKFPAKKREGLGVS